MMTILTTIKRERERTEVKDQRQVNGLREYTSQCFALILLFGRDCDAGGFTELLFAANVVGVSCDAARSSAIFDEISQISRGEIPTNSLMPVLLNFDLNKKKSSV